VVTGTCIDGMLEVGERVQILPGGLESKVRGIQVFGRQVDAVHAGRRAALNLPDVSHGDLTRGMLATLPGAMSPSRMVDVRLKVLPSAPFDLKAALRCTLHIHTQEIEARLFPSTGRAMAPGEEGVAQIRADRPVVCWPGDRFILRLPAPARTVGGGEVLLPARRKAHWSRPIDRKRLAAYGRKDPLGRWRAALAEAGPFGTNPADLSARMGLTVEKTLQVGSALSTRGDLVIRQPGDWWLDPEEAGQWDERAVSWLRRAQAAAGLIPWIPRQEFLERWKRIIGAERGDAVLRSLSEQGRVEVRGPRVRTAGHSVKLTGEQEAARKRIVSILEEGFPTPSSIKDLRREAGSGVDDVVAYMIDRGDLLRFSGDTVMLPAALVTIRERLARFASESAPLITVPEFKELFGLTRRTAMPLLEFLDDLRVTRREGDARRIL